MHTTHLPDLNIVKESAQCDHEYLDRCLCVLSVWGCFLRFEEILMPQCILIL